MAARGSASARRMPSSIAERTSSGVVIAMSFTAIAEW